MTNSTVEAVVQQALAKAPAEKSEDQPDPTKAPADQETTKTEASSSEGESSSEQTGRTSFEQELIEGMPEDERTEFDGLTAKEQTARLAFLKRVYRRDARQRTEEQKLRKAWGALQDAGVTSQHLADLVARVKSGTPAQQAKAEAEIKRGFAKAMSKATTPEEREEVREAEQIVTEQVEDIVERILEKRLSPLEARSTESERRRLEARKGTLEQEIDDLEEKDGFAASLVETYREEIRREGLKHPDTSAFKLLHLLATEDEIRKGRRAVNGASSTNGSPSRPAPLVKKTAPESKRPAPESGRPRLSFDKTILGILKRKV